MDIDMNIIESAKKAGKEIQEGKRQFDLPQTYDIDNVPIFAAGKWNGDTYTVEDLDEMVRAFNETKQQMKPYLKLGHDDKQGLIQKDGLPAAGWIESLTRQGKFLYAKFSRVPKKIYELIKAAAYRRVSSEIYLGMDVNGRKYGKLLKAVSLLGGDTPAVHELDDIIALYALGGEVKAYTGDHEAKAYEFTLSEKENTMSDELQKQLADALKAKAEMEVQVKELSEKTSAFEALSAENKTLKDSLAEATKKIGDLEIQVGRYADEKKAVEINAMLDEAVKNKKITPAQKPMLYTLLANASTEKKYKLGDAEKTPAEILKAFIDSNSVEINTDEQTGAGEPQKNDREALHQKALQYMEKHKVSYREAVVALSPSNPKVEDEE